ncbi:MAG: ABC transporter ATP-binding protein [bacterium]
MIELRDLTKIYNTGGTPAIGLSNINITFNKGEFVSIVGPSGSGKTTLLNVVSGMDSYEEGELILFNQETSSFKQEDFENYRRNNVAFIFQNYQLIDSYTVLDNVVIELLFKGVALKDAKVQAKDILTKVGLAHRLKHRTTKLSGGEKQRVVIARALASDCQILACDEPTGNLDSENSKSIVSLLKEISKEKLVLFVTHELSLVEEVSTRIVTIKDGKVASDVVKEEVKQIESTSLSTKHIKMTTNLYIAFKSIFSAPKRTIFLFIIFMIATFCVGGTVASMESDVFNDNNYFPIYRNDIDNRLIVYSNETYDFDAVVVENDYILDTDYEASISFNSNGFTTANLMVGFNPVVTNGVLPQNDNEVVLDVTTYNIESMQNALEEGYLIEVTVEGVTYKVVGFNETTSYDFTTIYFNDNKVLLKESTEYYKDVELFYLDTKQVTVKSSSDITLPYGSSIDDTLLTIGGKVISLENANVEYDNYFGYSYDFIEEYLEDNIYRKSYIFDDESDLIKAYNKLTKEGVVVINHNDIEDDYSLLIVVEEIMETGFIILITFMTLFIIIVVGAIANMILKSTVKDYTIMRIIGLDKRDIRFVLVFKMLLYVYLSYGLSILFFFLIAITPFGMKYDTLEGVAELFYFKNFFITFILISLIGLIIGLNHHKKMFKTSASSNLVGGDLL